MQIVIFIFTEYLPNVLFVVILRIQRQRKRWKSCNPRCRSRTSYLKFQNYLPTCLAARHLPRNSGNLRRPRGNDNESIWTGLGIVEHSTFTVNTYYIHIQIRIFKFCNACQLSILLSLF